MGYPDLEEVRASQMTESPPGGVDLLFVPPNTADAINTTVFNGRHRDACMILRDLWEPLAYCAVWCRILTSVRIRTF